MLRQSVQGCISQNLFENRSSRSQTYLFDQQIGIFFWVPEGGVGVEEAFGEGLLILNPLVDLPTTFLAFF
jgi:hypothetical protein